MAFFKFPISYNDWFGCRDITNWPLFSPVYHPLLIESLDSAGSTMSGLRLFEALSFPKLPNQFRLTVFWPHVNKTVIDKDAQQNSQYFCHLCCDFLLSYLCQSRQQFLIVTVCLWLFNNIGPILGTMATDLSRFSSFDDCGSVWFIDLFMEEAV